jgi:pimeloyl-ACP methyl ester carboxylesterase
MLETVTSRDGTRIAFDKSGQGRPVIFVGALMADRSAGAPLMAEMAKNFTAFNYDRRGRGDSGDTPPYAVDREIEDLKAVIDAAGGEAFVIGGSSGAVLALDAAARGVPVTKLALYEPPLVVDGSRPPVPGDYRARLTELLDAGRPEEVMSYYMTAMMCVPEEQVAAMRQGNFWPGWDTLLHTLPYDAAITEGTQTGKALAADRWSGLSVPTLVVDGGDSPPFMHSAAQALTEHLPVAAHKTLPGQTHAVDVAVLADVVTEYFSS